MLTGQNGILNRAVEAKEEATLAREKEKNNLNNYEEQMSKYIGIDWNLAKQNTQRHPEQKNSKAIGIGTDGKTVNMDLWEYTKLEDENYGLNDAESLTDNGIKTAGYLGEIIDGKIEGTVPKYIKDENDDDFFEVINMAYSFFNNKELIEAPEIPDGVTNIRALFNSCENLTTVNNLPSNAINMFGTFANCKKIKQVPRIPENVQNMFGTFMGCTSITEAPNIPNKVTDMSLTFYGCTGIEEAPNIPSGVVEMVRTFSGCTGIKESPEIPNGVTNISYMFDGCTNLYKAPIIPETVTKMYCTFNGCINLTKAPIIPKSVTVLCATFKGCSRLQGELEINASVTGKQLGEEWFNNIDYNNCLLNACTENGLTLKVTGTCTVIDKIVENANNVNITIK